MCPLINSNGIFIISTHKQQAFIYDGIRDEIWVKPKDV